MPVAFTKLRITGFKSFAEPATVELHSGLTGIVGPNGCGKSNVVEALRWAMGEASARSMRGGEMDDVIFAGTTHRASRNLAEVALTLESVEAGPAFPAPFHEQSELEISRRIERNSGSHYRLNGKEARARDIQTLFADLGSGARSSAMVSQGRVGALVGARPDERRAILEEAAGIGGLHARRHEAELKLRAAEANLERAEDLRTQLTAQLASLQRQAKQAARYRNLSSLTRAAEAELLALQSARATAARAHAHAHYAEATGALAEATTAAAALAAATKTASTGLPAARAAEADARTELERARIAREQLDAEQSRARIALTQAAEAMRGIERDLAHATQLHHDAAAAEHRLAAEANSLVAELARHPADAQRANTQASETEAACRDADAALHAATAEAAALAAHGQALAEGLRQADARATRFATALAAAQRDRAALHPIDQHMLDQADAAHAAAMEATRQAGTTLDGAEAAATAARVSHQSARAELHRAEPARARLAAEHGALNELLGLHRPGGPARLVDTLRVPPGLEPAIGAALGDDLELTEDTAAPRHLRPLDPLAAPEPLAGTTPLATLVDAPASLARALSRILLTEADGAPLQSALSPGQTLVSRDGGLWRWDGLVQHAGAPTAAAIRLRQRNRLADITRDLAEADRTLAAATVTANAAAAAEHQAAAAEATARQHRRAAEQATEQQHRTLLDLQRRADAAATRIAALDDQIARQQADADVATAERDQARAAHAALPDLAAARASADRARIALTAARAAEQQARAQLDAVLRQASARQNRQRAILTERAGWTDRAASATARLAELDQRREQAARTLAALGHRPAQLDTAIDAARESLDGAERRHRATAAALHAAERDAAEADRADRAADGALAAARESVLRAEAESRAADHAWGTIAERVLERLGHAADLPIAADLSADAEDRARRKHERLTREREEMGPVNLRADLEATEIETRLAAIDTDRAELAAAIAKLRGSIGHLNREGRERLNTVFTEVDRHFQQLFGRMFGGGRAQLALVGSDDPLTAGLEIYAQPPGKKLAALSLLSGGEQALTALSLIFAVFRCNPAPICVLDEVDAPLDDANIDRFCALLDDMVRETGTRFLVVTHHHLTMARMDRLYGVTMQERGVSRLLSVDLARASALAEQGANQPSGQLTLAAE